MSKGKDTDKMYRTGYNKHVAAQHNKHAIMKMSQEDRDQIISGLKANWEELHHQYQGLSVVTDTGIQWFSIVDVLSFCRKLNFFIENHS